MEFGLFHRQMVAGAVFDAIAADAARPGNVVPLLKPGTFRRMGAARQPTQLMQPKRGNAGPRSMPRTTAPTAAPTAPAATLRTPRVCLA